MDLMLRVLKFNVSGGFSNDIAAIYAVEDLTNFKGSPTDWLLIVRNAPYLTLQEAQDFYSGGVLDVTSNPENQIQSVRRCRYSVNWTTTEKAQADLDGWIDLDYSILSIVDNA